MEKNKPKKKAVIKDYRELTIKNDFMFCKIISDDAILCRDLIRVCIGKPVGNITYENAQQVFKVTSDGHGVRLDVYAEDDLNQAFDVEMENRNTGEYPERTLYYLGMMSRRQLRTADSYLNLRDNYVIFIMPFNLFPDVGLHRYTFVNRCIEAPDVTLDDRSRRIFICTKGKDTCDIPEELQALLDYIETGSIRNDLTKRLDDAIQKAKSNREWEAEYLELCEKYREYLMEGREEGREEGRAEGREEGRAEGREEVWRTMFKNGLSIEEISKYTETPIEIIRAALG